MTFFSTFVAILLKTISRNMKYNKLNNMKTSARTKFENGRNRVLRTCALLFSSMMLFAYNAMAQDGPSLGNVNKNANAIKEEQSKMTPEEIRSYIYMAVGFALVIAIAWFSTSLAKKRKIAADEERAKRHAHVKHSSHDPYFNHKGHKVRR